MSEAGISSGQGIAPHYQQMKVERTQTFPRPWGTIVATRYDAEFNRIANQKDEDIGYHLTVTIDGVSTSSFNVPAENFQGYLNYLDQVEHRIMAVVERHKEVNRQIRLYTDQVAELTYEARDLVWIEP